MSTDKSAVATETASTPLQLRLREALSRKGMKEREASRLAGAGLSFVSDILHGRSKAPNMAKIIALADTLDVEPEWLAGNVEHHIPKAGLNFPQPDNMIAMTAAEHAKFNGRIPLYAAKMASSDVWAPVADRPVTHVKPLPGLELVDGAYAVTVPNDLNAPRYYAGETIYASPAATIMPGNFVVARLKIGGLAIGRLESINSSGGALHQIADSDGYLIDFKHSEIDSLHKVVGSTS